MSHCIHAIHSLDSFVSIDSVTDCSGKVKDLVGWVVIGLWTRFCGRQPITFRNAVISTATPTPDRRPRRHWLIAVSICFDGSGWTFFAQLFYWKFSENDYNVALTKGDITEPRLHKEVQCWNLYCHKVWPLKRVCFQNVNIALSMKKTHVMTDVQNHHQIF